MSKGDRAHVEQMASDWLVRRMAGLDEHEGEEFAHWLEADPLHRATLTRLEQTWQTLKFPREVGRADVALAELTRRRRRRVRRNTIGATAGMAALAALALAFLPRPRALPSVAAETTAVVHPDDRHLPDGSVVELNAGAQFDFNFTDRERDVVLTKGEALFSVAHDQTHPFIVAAGGVKVQAVGTAFNVRLRPDSVDILVTEGRVKVAVPGSDDAVYISAGERATVPLQNVVHPAVKPASPSEMRRELAWHSKRIEFTHAPLSEVAEIFNRENPVKLKIGDESIRNLQITGIYWADDPEGLIRLLNTGLDLRAERMPGQVVLRAPKE